MEQFLITTKVKITANKEDLTTITPFDSEKIKGKIESDGYKIISEAIYSVDKEYNYITYIAEKKQQIEIPKGIDLNKFKR